MTCAWCSTSSEGLLYENSMTRTETQPWHVARGFYPRNSCRTYDVSRRCGCWFRRCEPVSSVSTSHPSPVRKVLFFHLNKKSFLVNNTTVKSAASNDDHLNIRTPNLKCQARYKYNGVLVWWLSYCFWHGVEICDIFAPVFDISSDPVIESSTRKVFLLMFFITLSAFNPTSSMTTPP